MMRQPNSSRDTESGVVNNINSVLQEIHSDGQTQLSSATHFNPTSFHDNFLEQMLSSVHSSAASFPWADDQMESGVEGHLEDQSPALLGSNMRQHQISNGTDMALMLQQHLLLSRGLIAANGLRSPTGADAGLLPVLPADHNDFVDASSFKSANLADDASVKALFSGFTGSLDQTANLPQHLHHPQGGELQAQNHGTPSATAAASDTTGGATAGQPKQRVRARRGQATDPHSIAERLRRERIAERMKSLQELVPNANKTDKASMLDEIIDYVKFLQLQVKVLSMSRLGGAAAVSPMVADEGRSINGPQTASSSSIMNDGTTVAEHQVLKLMEEDMGSAMQYLQGKGLCLMPISLATAISTATCCPKNSLTPTSNLNTSGATISPLHNGEAGGPSSPNMSVLTIQSSTMGHGQVSLKETTSTSKLD